MNTLLIVALFLAVGAAVLRFLVLDWRRHQARLDEFLATEYQRDGGQR